MLCFFCFCFCLCLVFLGGFCFVYFCLVFVFVFFLDLCRRASKRLSVNVNGLIRYVCLFVCLMVFNGTFSNISAIPLRSALFVEDPEKTTDLSQVTDKLSDKVFYYIVPNENWNLLQILSKQEKYGRLHTVKFFGSK